MEFQREELDEILNIFQQESIEIIAAMDEKLLFLEREPNNPEIAMQLFRDAHSLKGSARMLGFNDIQNIAHKIEDIISLVREEKLVLTVKVGDTISECLDFISTLINKTVSLKQAYKSPDVDLYIKKLDDLIYGSEDDDNFTKKSFFLKFENIERVAINILYIVTYAHEHENYMNIFELENELNTLLFLFEKTNDEGINEIKLCIRNVLFSLEKYKDAENKKSVFVELFDTVHAFIDTLGAYADKQHIKRSNYWEAVEKKLNSPNDNDKNITPFNINRTKIEEIIQKLPMMEINCDYYDEAFKTINQIITAEQNDDIRHILSCAKQILLIYKKKNKTLVQDVSLGLMEVFEAVKSEDAGVIKEAKAKIDVIKIMTQFENDMPKRPREVSKTSQKDILNTITNSQIKTLRIDSVKLDNLAVQIGELIVSKIKTNEELSIAKKINNELIEWQKNFNKMSYYIKYFDKKYLSESFGGGDDLRKIISYNKQLSTLAQSHSDKITEIIRETSRLFKHLQESETKLNATTTEIKEMVKNMRILPLQTIFQLFPRMVHNIARDQNKKIDLFIEGADITADKTIIEEIKIPLMHIIRNSIDHGIEDVDTRKFLGKNPIGRIEIKASLKDNKVVIDVKDDGRGLDIEKIKAKALEKHILTEEELNVVGEEEITNLIFYPGFSTEDVVTDLSGRGLGLDIVNNKISQLQGRIDIFSQVKKGTVVRITLPAVIATKKVFVIEENKQLLAIETSAIKTIVRINADEVFEKDNNNYYVYNGIAIAVYTLSQILNYENTPRETFKYTLMIIEADNLTFGVIVEKLIADQEIVHKKLAAPLYKVKNISGITTLANGEACLILSVPDIIAAVNSKKIGSKIILKNGRVRTRNNFKYKILVVDDSATTRILQKNILANNGYNVSTATSPISALEKMKEDNYDLIISDVQMPEMSGFEFIDEFRKIKNYASTPVIIVSSEPREFYEKEISNNNILTYIQKNLFKQDELLKCLENTLNY